MKRSLLRILPLLLAFQFVPGLYAAGQPDLGATKKREGNILYFEGRGEPRGQEGNRTQARSLSQEAAILDGKAKIAYYLDGLKAKAGGTLKEAAEKDKKVQIRVQAFLKKVAIVKSEWSDDDACVVLLKIDRKQLMKSLPVSEVP